MLALRIGVCRMLESGQFGTPSSWESSLSSYSLESSLVDLPSAAEPPAERGNLKSENSFGCSFDSYDNSMALESSKENSTKACKPRAKDPPSNVKASLADRHISSGLATSHTPICMLEWLVE